MQNVLLLFLDIFVIVGDENILEIKFNHRKNLGKLLELMTVQNGILLYLIITIVIPNFGNIFSLDIFQ